MFELQYVVGAVMVLTEALKRLLRKRWRRLDPAIPVILALALGALLNLLNAYLFIPTATADVLRQAVKDGLMAAGMAMGLYAGGTKYIENKITSKLTTAANRVDAAR